MAADADADTERVAVKTYVPAYQREEWDEHSDHLDMSRSEFVRSMVQAGRRGFGARDGTDTDTNSENPDETSATNDDQSSFEEKVLDVLSEEPKDWDALLSELTDDIEQRLDETLQQLQDRGRVRYSGREGGYILDE